MTANVPCFAFGFGNLAMLGWLAAVAAPVLIHLWSRRQYREVPWAAVEFLIAAMRKNARRFRLQQWLLLALRTLLILAVVLAVAEPYWGTAAGTPPATAPEHRVLVLDVSYSMAYDEGGSRLEAARQQARELIDNAAPGDAFSLVVMSDRPQVPFGLPVVDHAAVAQELRSINQTHGGADLQLALAELKAILSAPESRQRYSRRVVTFFSDLDAATWQVATSAEQGVRQLLAEIAQTATVQVVDVGSGAVGNVAITELTIPAQHVTVGSEVPVKISLRRAGSDGPPQVDVKLKVSGQAVARRTVEFGDAADATFRFTHRFAEAGEFVVSAHCSADRLTVDDSRWLVVPVEQSVPVLCVAGKQGAADYLARALNPHRSELNLRPQISPQIVADGELLDIALQDFACVFLVNVAQLTSDEVAALARYVSGGGGLFTFLGDQVRAEQYNELATSGASPLMPVRMGEVVRHRGFGIDPLDYRHPVVAPFRGRERAGLLTTPISHYVRLQPRDATEVHVAAALPNGDPLIVTGQVGQGRTVVVATAASTASVDAATGQPWTAMPTWPSFLPIVRELLAFATGGGDRGQLLVGTELTGRLFARQTETALPVLRPDNTHDTATVIPTVEGANWSYAATDLSGIYSCELPEEVVRRAVNVAPADGLLQRVDSEQLPATIVMGRDLERQFGSVPLADFARGQLGRALIMVAIALALVEVGAAWLFAQGNR